MGKRSAYVTKVLVRYIGSIWEFWELFPQNLHLGLLEIVLPNSPIGSLGNRRRSLHISWAWEFISVVPHLGSLKTFFLGSPFGDDGDERQAPLQMERMGKYWLMSR